VEEIIEVETVQPTEIKQTKEMKTQTEEFILTVTGPTRTETTTESKTPTNKRRAKQQANQNIQTKKHADDQRNTQKHQNSTECDNDKFKQIEQKWKNGEAKLD